MLISKRITAILAALALSLPVAPAAVGYDAVCVRNSGAYNATFEIVFKDRVRNNVAEYAAGQHTRGVDFSDKNDSAEFTHFYNRYRISPDGRGLRPGNTTYCASRGEIAEAIGRDPLPGEAFALRAEAGIFGKSVDCHQANNHRRWDDDGRPWHRVFNWTGRGGNIWFTAWGTTLHPHCDIRDGEYMWAGCEQGREGFRKSACYPWRPQITGGSAYDLTADENKSVAYLASVARRGANLDARVNNEYPLHVAVRLDRLDHTKVLLGQGPYLNGGYALDSDRNRARLNWQNANGESPLYLAAQLGRIEHARALLGNRADANLVNAQGNPPLMAAVLHNSTGPNFEAMLVALAGAGADINAPGGDGRTPLMVAVEKGESPEVLRVMLRTGANPEQFDRHRAFSPIHRATAHSVESIAALISNGANINVPDGGGLTPLLWASDMNADFNIDAAADPDKNRGVEKKGKSEESRRQAMALEMIAMGADPSIVAADGRHPLMTMTESGMSADGLREVVDAGGLAETPDARGFTPIHAAIRRSPNILNAVLSGGANVDTPDRNGFTPLMWAMNPSAELEEGSVAEMVEELLAAGADPRIENNNGDTALSLARKNGMPDEIVARLSELAGETPPETPPAQSGAGENSGENAINAINANADIGGISANAEAEAKTETENETEN